MKTTKTIATIIDTAGTEHKTTVSSEAVRRAWNVGNNAGDGFEPGEPLPREPKPYSDEVILTMLGGRVVAVGWSNGSWAVDVTDALAAEMK